MDIAIFGMVLDKITFLLLVTVEKLAGSLITFADG
jgi:hypothetical protein